MTSFIRSRVTFVWLMLVAATALSWEMGHGVGLHDIRHVRTAIIIVAFVKVRFVILDFMEIRHAPRFMRVIGEVWLTVVCLALIGLYMRAG